jgi:hypothetical protein
MGIPVNDQTFGGINIDRGTCIRETTDHGFIIAGFTNSYGAGGYDAYLIKTDSLLDTLWTKTYGGTDWDFANCVQQTTDGGYIICGGTYSYGAGNEDYYLIKTSSLGNIEWTKTYGDTLEDVANAVIQTSDGGYLITGTTKSMGDTLGDFYTIKTDMNGDTIWTNKFGGAHLDYGNDCLESRYGGYMVGGETQSFGLGAAGSSDGVIIKLNTAGHVDSTIVTGVPGNDNITTITEDRTGRVAMVGIIADAFGYSDISLFMIKNNWRYYYGTSFGSSRAEVPYSVDTTRDGGFILCGYTTSFNKNLPDIYLIKTTQASDSADFYNTHDSFFTTNIENYLMVTNSLFNIYPNPANTSATIYIENENFSSSIIISNILGEEVKQITINKNSSSQIPLNVEDLQAGIYFITLSSKDKTLTKKLIIQH